MHKIHSSASFSLRPVSVSTPPFSSQDGFDRTAFDRTGLGLERSGLERTGIERTGLERTGLERTDTLRTGSPCPSVFDTMGLSDVRAGFRYIRIISRKNGKEKAPTPQRKNGSRIFGFKNVSKSQFTIPKSPKQSVFDFQKKSIYTNNISDFRNKNFGTSLYPNSDSPGPFFSFDVELNSTKKKKEERRSSKIDSGDKEVEEGGVTEVKRSKNNQNNDESNNNFNNSNNSNPDNESTHDQYVREQYGHCNLSMEELEILFSPSAQWISAIGTFFALPSTEHSHE